jgi:5-oxoprolinase (ATP-hydrolysing) subunit A
MEITPIDLNCDMAEGIGNEKELMPWISSANIACGFHAGNEELMKETIGLCLKHNVAIGAHPSFPDRGNFGRTNMNLAREKIIELITDQLSVLERIAGREGGKLHHVKPHGALYNMAAKDRALANSIANAIKNFDDSLILYGLSQSVMIAEAENLHLKAAHEVFADRTYQPDGSLTPRTQPDALIVNEADALGQAIRFVRENKVKTVSGKEIDLKADTICLHGDGKHAVEFARLIFSYLMKEKITVKTIS